MCGGQGTRRRVLAVERGIWLLCRAYGSSAAGSPEKGVDGTPGKGNEGTSALVYPRIFYTDAVPVTNHHLALPPSH
jgi:hypothetical protein